MSRILCILGPSNAVVRGDNNTCALRMEKHRECTAISEIDAGRSGGNNTVLESSQGTRDCFAQLFELNTTCVEQIDTCVKKADEKSCHHESKLYDRVNCILQTEHQCSYYPVMASRDYFPSVVFPPDSRVFCPLDRPSAACYKGSREDQVRCLARECFVSLGDRAYEFAHQAENCIAKAVQQCFNKAAQIALSRAQRFEERVECTASEIETQCKNFNFQFPNINIPLPLPEIEESAACEGDDEALEKHVIDKGCSRDATELECFADIVIQCARKLLMVKTDLWGTEFKDKLRILKLTGLVRAPLLEDQFIAGSKRFAEREHELEHANTSSNTVGLRIARPRTARRRGARFGTTWGHPLFSFGAPRWRSRCTSRLSVRSCASSSCCAVCFPRPNT